MAYQSISEYNAPPVFQSLVSQGRVSQPMFAFKLSEAGSELALGAVDDSKYTGSFTYAPVTTQVGVYSHYPLNKSIHDPTGLLASHIGYGLFEWEGRVRSVAISHRHRNHPHHRRCGPCQSVLCEDTWQSRCVELRRTRLLHVPMLLDIAGQPYFWRTVFQYRPRPFQYRSRKQRVEVLRWGARCVSVHTILGDRRCIPAECLYLVRSWSQ